MASEGLGMWAHMHYLTILSLCVKEEPNMNFHLPLCTKGSWGWKTAVNGTLASWVRKWKVKNQRKSFFFFAIYSVPQLYSCQPWGHRFSKLFYLQRKKVTWGEFKLMFYFILSKALKQIISPGARSSGASFKSWAHSLTKDGKGIFVLLTGYLK